MRELDFDSTSLVDLCLDILPRGGIVRFIACGSSMAPTIENGGVIFVESRGKANFGNIVLAKVENEHVVAHRVVQIKRESGETWMCLQGDNTLVREWVRSDAVLGHIVAVQRAGRIIRLETILSRSLWAVKYHLLRFRRSLWERFRIFKSIFVPNSRG